MENRLSKAEEAFIEKITEHLDRTPEEVKEALNLNRQQRKQYLKEQEKKIRAAKKLSPTQIAIMKELVDREKEKIEQWAADNTVSFYSSVNSVLYSNFGFTGEQTTILWDKVEKLIDEDREVRKYFSEIDKEEWRKMENKVNEFIKKELEAGAKQKEIIVKLKKAFPKLSTAMCVNAVKEAKEGWNKEKNLEGKSTKQIIEDEFEERQAKADEEIKAINKGEVKAGMIKQTGEGIEIHTLSIAEQLKRKLNIKASEEEKVEEELKELEKLIATKKEKINKIQEDMARMEEAFAILEPINI